MGHEMSDDLKPGPRADKRNKRFHLVIEEEVVERIDALLPEIESTSAKVRHILRCFVADTTGTVASATPSVQRTVQSTRLRQQKKIA